VSDDSQIRLARRLSLWLGLIGTLVALLMAGFEIKSLWDVFLQIMGLFGSGLAGIFILGIFTVRTNARGAICGAITSAVVLFLVPRYTNLHFFLNAAIGIVTCVATGYLTSRLFPVTQPPLTNLTIHTRQKLESETG
jgi:Na+/proline symporter